jgi:hypothetical protein
MFRLVLFGNEKYWKIEKGGSPFPDQYFIEMDVVVIDSDLWKIINERLEKIEKNLASNLVGKESPSKSEKINNEIDNWILLKHAYTKLGISRAQWYSKYQKIIKHRNYAGTTWVYAPSILDFFESNNIN